LSDSLSRQDENDRALNGSCQLNPAARKSASSSPAAGAATRAGRTISRFAVFTRIRRVGLEGRSAAAAFRNNSAALTGAGRPIR
jgi:hypothetical protein